MLKLFFTNRRAAPLVFLALHAWAAPASATPGDTLLVTRPAPNLEAQAPFGRAFWERVRAEARRFRDLEGGASRYARRYRISPELARTIHESARAEGIDPELGFRLVRVESVFKPDARGPGGALGLVQLMPGTARSIDRSLDTEAEVLEPRTNLRTGFRYLRQMIRRYGGDVRLGLLAYNRGETAVDRALRRGADPENGYSKRVLGRGGDGRYTGTGVLEP